MTHYTGRGTSDLDGMHVRCPTAAGSPKPAPRAWLARFWSALAVAARRSHTQACVRRSCASASRQTYACA